MPILRSFLAICVFAMLAVPRVDAQATKKPPASAGQTAQQQTAERELRSPSRIRGRVISESGRPVPDATVMVFPLNIASNVQGAVTSLLRPVTSDTDGKFELTSLSAGAYSITASAPGYVLSDQDSKAFYRPGDNATLTLVKGGVITGRVTNSSGEPVVGARIKGIKIRELNNKRLRVREDIGSQFSDSLEMMLGPFTTDDRGIYRLYGLAPGYYQVAAGGRSSQGFSLGGQNAYNDDAPTYFPSSTIETAAEVTVQAGEEATGIDIRYRENRGHSMGGTVTVAAGPPPQAITVLLTRAGNGVVEATTIVMGGRENFGFDTLLNGEYVVTAMGTSGNMMTSPGSEGITASVSQPRRVTIKDADVSGISLVVEPLASIAGRLVVEPLEDVKQKPLCKDIRPVPIEGTVLSTLNDHKEEIDAIIGPLGAFKDTTPNEKGEFNISLLRAGVHRVDVQMPADHLYLKSITLPQSDPNGKPIDAAKDGVKLRSGDRIKGLLVTMARGAARLTGKVLVGADEKPPEAKMRVHLVPAEPEASEDVLRYFEVDVAADGTFTFSNLQPGKYWLLGRATSDPELAESDRTQLAWDAGTRKTLRSDAEASKNLIELTQCQITPDYRLKYVPQTKSSKPEKKTN